MDHAVEPMTITAPEFVAAVFATLALAGERSLIDFGTELDQHFERAYDRFLQLTDRSKVAPNFTLRTNKLGGDSTVFRECLYMLNRRGIVTIHNPDHRVIEFKLSDARANQLLESSYFTDPNVRAAIIEAMTS